MPGSPRNLRTLTADSAEASSPRLREYIYLIIDRINYMALYQDSDISIYFGDCSDNLFISEQAYIEFQNTQNILTLEPFSKLQQSMNMHALCFPHQVHCTTGYAIDKYNLTTIKPFSLQGDYLITNLPGVGLGILTADCLPVLLYDPEHKAIAAIHAGWRGSVAGIVLSALDHMAKVFSTKPNNVRAFFGPAAGKCCYKVGTDLIQAIKKNPDEVLSMHNNEYFFDLPGYNRLLLEQAGLQPTACSNTFAQCTICNHQYWSYRRQQKKAGRQMTIICLK
jgi:YfiH family protein